MNIFRVLSRSAAVTLVSVALIAVPSIALAADSFTQSLRPIGVLAVHDQTPNPAALWDPTSVNVTDASVIADNSPVTKTSPKTNGTIGVPTTEPLLVLTGPASYYSEIGCLGCNGALRMANGQTLDDSRATVAIPAHLVRYVGRTARLTNLVNNKTVMVPITDTGGFYAAKYGFRVADMSVATKLSLGIAGGMGHVKLEIF